jgi:serine/threonine protein kinase
MLMFFFFFKKNKRATYQGERIVLERFDSSLPDPLEFSQRIQRLNHPNVIFPLICFDLIFFFFFFFFLKVVKMTGYLDVPGAFVWNIPPGTVFLFNFVQQQNLSLREKMRLLIEILSGLKYLHQQGSPQPSKILFLI